MLDDVNFHIAELYTTCIQDNLDESTYHKKTEAIVGDENSYKFILVCLI